MDIAKLAIEVDASQATAAAKQLQTLQTAAGKTDTAVQKSTGSFRIAGNGVQMMGYQIQDIAVQLGAGTSPFIVLSQQGSQVASLFGPGGAVIGALLAVSGAIAGPLVSSLMRSTATTDKMSEAIRTLREELNKVTEKQTIAALVEESSKLEKGFDMLSSPVRSVRREGEKLLETITGVSAGFLSNSELTLAAEKRLRENNSLIKQQKKLIEETNIARAQEFGPDADLFYQAKWAAEKKLAQETIAAEKKLAQEALAADSLRLQSRASALKAIEAIEVQQMSQQERITDNYLTQQSQIASALAQGVIDVQEANALKLASDQQYAEQSYTIALQQQQQQMQLNDIMLSSAKTLSANLVDALESYGAESTDLGLAAIAVQKGLMVAQAIMSAELAAVQTQAAYAALAAVTANPALIPVGEANAQVVRGMGYASAALIAATEFAPARALGGQVEAGKTYMWQENGIEYFTPGMNGYVTPNDKLGGSNQTVVLQISTGVSQTVRAEMAAMMPGIVKMIGQATQGARR